MRVLIINMDLLQLLRLTVCCFPIVACVLSNEIDLQAVVKDFSAEFDTDIETFGENPVSDSVSSHAPAVNKRLAEFSDQFTKHSDMPSTDEESEENDLDVQNMRKSDVPIVITEKVDTVENTTLNTTEDSPTNATLVSCVVGKEAGKPVELVNSTRLLNLLVSDGNITNRRMPAECVLLLFYARHCPFSSLAAPHFNALPRAFPDLKIAAIDAMKYHSFNTQFGIVGVPTVMLFHNGRPAAKFNDSDYTLEMFGRFITKYTGLEPRNKLFVMSADFGGPVPSVPVRETDHCLVLSCIFIVLCAVYYFSKSAWWQWIVEAIQNTWREAEAQHEHAD